MKKYFIYLVIITFCICLIYSVKAIQTEPQFVEGYSRELPFTYSADAFYVNGEQCGYGCDKFGRNCKKGICNPKDCATKNGYTQITSISKGFNHMVMCQNPTTNMSYSVYSEYNITKFFLNNIGCGENCDINGQNCKRGLCNAADCDTEHGFTLVNITEKGFYGSNDKKWVCHNADKNLSYYIRNKHNLEFYYHEYHCGENCDLNGKNCQYDSHYDLIGICNPEDCPKGYTPHAGYCRKNNGNKLLYKDKDGKFKNESLRSTMNGINMFVHYADWLLIPWHHY